MVLLCGKIPAWPTEGLGSNKILILFAPFFTLWSATMLIFCQQQTTPTPQLQRNVLINTIMLEKGRG